MATATITTSITIQYSRDTLGTLGSIMTRRWTTEHLPRWVDEEEVPQWWEGEYVGTARPSEEEEEEFLRRCYDTHLTRVPAGCNHRSQMIHTFGRADVPASLWQTMTDREVNESIVVPNQIG